MLSSVIEPGQVIAGRYRVERWLGQGAMGSVYRALQLSVGRPVALKLLVDDPLGDARYLERFEREALALSRLTHPNTVRLFDFGSAEPGRPFLVMELLNGADLAEDLEQQGPLRWDQALLVLRQVGCSLAEAHAAGIVHRDIKPANIFLCAGAEWPKVKLLDFGIAGDAQRGLANKLTRTGTVVGSPAYMSPEQARGLAVAPASDLYGLGVVAFEALTGRTPFDGRAFTAQLLAKVLEPAPSLGEVCPALDVPDEVQALIAELLERDPLRRPASAGVLIERIDALLSRAALSPLERDVLPRMANASEPATTRAAALTEPMLVARTIDEGWSPRRTGAPATSMPRPRRWRGRLLAATLVGGGALVGGLFFVRERASLDGGARLEERDVEPGALGASSRLAAASSPAPGTTSPSMPVATVAAAASSPAELGGVLMARAATIAPEEALLTRAAAAIIAPGDPAAESDEVSSTSASPTPAPPAIPSRRTASAHPQAARPAAAETPSGLPLPRRRPESAATAPRSATPQPSTPASVSPPQPVRREPLETWVVESSSPEPAASAAPPATVAPAATSTPAPTASNATASASTPLYLPGAPPPVETSGAATRPANPGLVFIDPATPLAPPTTLQTPEAATPPLGARARTEPPPDARAVGMPASRLLRRFPNVAATRAALAAGVITPLQRNRIVALLLERRRSARGDATRDYQAGRIDRSQLRARLRAIELELEGP